MLVRTLLFLLLGLSLAAALRAQAGSANSPFSPANSAAGAPAVPPDSDFEFAGVISSGSQTLVGILDHSAKKNVWVAVGASSDGVEVVSYDAAHNTATIRVRGATKLLPLKAAVTKTGQATPPTVAPIAAGPLDTSKLTPAQQEREARMLVSDLLEIGIQQRKAYEQAHAAKPSASPTPSPANASAPATPPR